EFRRVLFRSTSISYLSGNKSTTFIAIFFVKESFRIQDYDDENNVPAEYTAFRNKIKEMDALLFVTPEYNRSVPGVLKNAIDVGSRPKVDNVWNGKPAVIY